VQLFFPELWNALKPDSLSFQDQELFTDITSGEKYAADLVVQGQLKDRETPILIHVEHQARSESSFPRRMFIYFYILTGQPLKGLLQTFVGGGSNPSPVKMVNLMTKNRCFM